MAFASALLVLATAAMESAATGPARGPWDAVEASILGGTVALTFPRSFDARALDPLAFGLVVNGGDVAAPVLVEDDLAANRTLRLIFLDGAGSGDSARLVAPREGPRVVDHEVVVATPLDGLPSPRWGAPLASDGEFAFAFGGAVDAAAFAPDEWYAWRALVSITRVDLASGDTRTMRARLPAGAVAGAAFFDARPSPECPAGCAFVLGGGPSPAEASSAILRYDPVGDAIETLASALPEPLLDPALVWTGTHALLIGGGSASVIRFDPVTGAVDDLGPNAPGDAHAMVGVFDPRPSPECPEGCGYLFGGKGSPDTNPPTTTMLLQRDLILRVDASTGRVVPVAARLPVAVEAPTVAWDGERAIVIGGRTCVTTGCSRSAQAFAFDPRTLEVEALPSLEEGIENASGLWHDGRVVIVSGKCGGSDCMLDRVLRYDPGSPP